MRPNLEARHLDMMDSNQDLARELQLLKMPRNLISQEMILIGISILGRKLLDLNIACKAFLVSMDREPH